MVRKHSPRRGRPEGPFGQFRRFQRKLVNFRFFGLLEVGKSSFGAISRETPIQNYLFPFHNASNFKIHPQDDCPNQFLKQ